MKTKTLILAIAICFAAQGVWAQRDTEEKEEDYTAFFFCDNRFVKVVNGRGWNKMPKAQQVGAMHGIHEGMLLMANEMSYKESVPSERIMNAIDRHYTPDSSMSEDAAGVTAFYSDSTNMRLPIIEAYRFVKMKAVGATPEELGRYLANLRKKYNQTVKP